MTNSQSEQNIVVFRDTPNKAIFGCGDLVEKNWKGCSFETFKWKTFFQARVSTRTFSIIELSQCNASTKHVVIYQFLHHLKWQPQKKRFRSFILDFSVCRQVW